MSSHSSRSEIAVRSAAPAAAASPGTGALAPGDRIAKLACAHAAITAFGVTVIFAIWFAAVLHVYFDREGAVAVVARQNDTLAIAFAKHVERAFRSADQAALFLRHQYPTAGAGLSLEALGIIDATSIRNFAVIDARGETLISSDAPGSEQFTGRDFFEFQRSHDTDQLFVGKPTADKVPGAWTIPLARRISNADGSFGGIVVVFLKTQPLIDFYRQAELDRGALIELAGLDGVVRVRKTGDTQSYGDDLSAKNEFRARARSANGNLEVDDGSDVARFLSYRTLDDYPLMVAVGIASEQILAPLRRERNGYYLMAALASLITMWIMKMLLDAIAKDKQAVEALERSEACFRATFNHAAIGMMQTELDGRILRVNRKLCEMLGYMESELLGLSYRNFSHPEDIASTEERRSQLMAGNGISASVEKRYLHKDGSVIWVAVSPALVWDANGNPDYFVNMVECITERKKLQENLEHLARHDSLTELPNRALFYKRLKHALEQARRRDWITGVMFIDLDRFKTINDTLGHGVGDELLQQVAKRLRNCVRGEDTVGRLGGDEFAVILAELANEESAGIVAQKILDALGKPFQLERHEVFITTSIGIATCNPGMCDADTMISNADAAMYDAKSLGRNNFQFYAVLMSERAMERLLLEKELRYALSRNEFLLNFQPKVNLKSGEISGFEALLRWHRTGGEVVSPAIFIPVVEDCGLIEEVGEWVLRSACAQIAAWQQAGYKAVPVAVNLSPKQFLHQDIGGVILRALQDYKVDPALLELEITESAAMKDAEGAIAVLQKIKALGVRIAIDDFGTGYSSLSYLTRFPIDSLKIDRSFVVDLPDSKDDASIARAVITMAHALRLKVIAEGVEVAEQLEFLAANGCDEIQGYYFSRPLPAELATEMLSGKLRLLGRLPQQTAAAA